MLSVKNFKNLIDLLLDLYLNKRISLHKRVIAAVDHKNCPLPLRPQTQCGQEGSRKWDLHSLNFPALVRQIKTGAKFLIAKGLRTCCIRQVKLCQTVIGDGVCKSVLLLCPARQLHPHAIPAFNPLYTGQQWANLTQIETLRTVRCGTVDLKIKRLVLHKPFKYLPCSSPPMLRF